jgi:regulator of cell morphogenesis and NO signaling
MNDRLEHATVGDLVASDFRRAGILERHGIDFCCGGRRSLGEACRLAAADPEAVLRDLRDLPPGDSEDDVADWPIEQLIDHIESKHHSYVRAAMPRIAAYLTKLVAVHGARHPELSLLESTFRHLRADFEQHLVKEEEILFPYIRQLAANGNFGFRASPFGSVENPIRMMEREHRDAGDEMLIIRDLTCGYRAPSDGCTTYNVCLSELKAFESDLHRHVHLENNVLFPKAVFLEQRRFQ